LLGRWPCAAIPELADQEAKRRRYRARKARVIVMTRLIARAHSSFRLGFSGCTTVTACASTLMAWQPFDYAKGVAIYLIDRRRRILKQVTGRFIEEGLRDLTTDIDRAVGGT